MRLFIGKTLLQKVKCREATGTGPARSGLLAILFHEEEVYFPEMQ